MNRINLSSSKRFILRDKLFIPIRFEKSRKIDKQERGHDYLQRAGYIKQANAGMFMLLPNGYRVLRNIIKVIDDELQNIHCEPTSMPLLHSSLLWKKSGRWDKMSKEMIKLKDRHDHAFCLSPTAEEMFCDLISQSQRDSVVTPLRLYQIGPKYRDEARPRGALLRAREFWMKDLYTFDASAEDALQTYHEVCAAYSRIWQRLGLSNSVVAARAVTGDIGGDLSHEYQVLHERGEDRLLICESCGESRNIEFDNVKQQQEQQQQQQQCCSAMKWTESRGIEIAQAFLLGQKYSKSFNLTCSNNNNNSDFIQMGCYGIGVSRILSTLALLNADDYGLKWPTSIAPFESIVIIASNTITNENELIKKVLNHDINNNNNNNNNTNNNENKIIIDNRNSISFKSKLEEALLIGYSRIYIIGKQTIDKNEYNVFNREDYNDSNNNLNKFIRRF